MRLFNQIVGRIALRRDHHDNIVACAVGIGDDIRNIHHSFGIGNRAAAEFLHYQSHKNLQNRHKSAECLPSKAVLNNPSHG